MASLSSRFNFAPAPINLAKERVGPAEDGGYVVSPLISSETSHLISFGIGGDERFEDDFSLRFGSKAVMVDPGYDLDSQKSSAEKALRLSGKAIPEGSILDAGLEGATH